MTAGIDGKLLLFGNFSKNISLSYINPMINKRAAAFSNHVSDSVNPTVCTLTTLR